MESSIGRRMTDIWLSYCSACSVPEIASVFRKSRIPVYQVTGLLKDDKIWNEVSEWVEAARVAHTMWYNRLGVMCNYYGSIAGYLLSSLSCWSMNNCVWEFISHLIINVVLK
jgi:L-arabinose isomerase